MKFLQPFFVLLAFSLVLIDASVYALYIFPFSLHRQSLWISVLQLSVAASILFCILSSHLLCIITGPGSTAECNRQDLMAAHDADECSGQWRWCKKCDLPKPPLSHHCSICNRCVLHMDHHCPWMATCIGFKNLQHFLRYLAWMVIGCCYSAFIYINHLVYLLKGSYGSQDLARMIQNQPVICTLAFVCIVIGLAVLGLLAFNVYLVAQGSGTVELWIQALGDERDKGGQKKGSTRFVVNWKVVFDLEASRLWFILWLIPSIRPKKGRGYERRMSSL